MSLRVIVVPDAQAQIDELDYWWRTNRPAAPTLFEEGLERVFALLAITPNIGRPSARRGIPGLREYRVRKTPYKVYYVPQPEVGQVKVISVWSAVRKHGPPLRPR